MTGLDAEGTDPSESLILSVCTTSYNIAHAIERHFSSVCNALAGISFEYVVVDNRSSDGTAEILSRLAHSFPGFKVIARRCSRGIGRRLAASASKAPTILCVDADTVYRPSLGAFVRLYLKEFRSRDIALQAIYAGLYPRSLWFQVGGTRDLNYAEDLDLWMRIWELGRMKWTPVLMGENLKPSGVRDSEDVFYKRYSMLSRVSRVLRKFDATSGRSCLEASGRVAYLSKDSFVVASNEVPCPSPCPLSTKLALKSPLIGVVYQVS